MSDTNHIQPIEPDAEPQQPNIKPEMREEEELDSARVGGDVDMDMHPPTHVPAMNLDGPTNDDVVVPADERNMNMPPVDATIDVSKASTGKKDATLREFLSKMDDYAPIIPDAVTNYYLTKAGLPPPPQTPTQLARLIALATQKFIADIAADAYQYSRIRASNTSSNTAAGGIGGGAAGGGGGGAGGGGAGTGGAGPAGKEGVAQHVKGGNILGAQRPGYGGGGQGAAQGRTVLTMEDLGMAVGEYGVNIQRGEFYR